ncbi:helix-turn-helix domain-containing protein [Levilactobacillus brevis]|uniref:helix-turn-helix domain-containing protein n=1 Tax=Levilactobacillus brevis TaxID=1580 RepID=UPI0012E8BAFD|nr:helix-turn-helix transcriptional regulator [Levilactobacillus brevis]MUV40616.1 helix-turn-helix domain-containing protein [Levilactobacillus brevis]
MTMFEKIKKIAKERGYSLSQLNDKAGLKTNVIYSWKTKAPSADKLKAVADVLGVSVDYLIGKNNTPEWANTKDTNDLEKFLADNEGSMTYGGEDLTEEEKQQVRVAMTTIFWKRHRHD